MSRLRESFCFEGFLWFKAFYRTCTGIRALGYCKDQHLLFCAEWEFGGMPAWLLNKKGCGFRTNTLPFMDCVDRYYKKIIFKFWPLCRWTIGGPIIMMQIENEYGYYGDDKEYLLTLKGLIGKVWSSCPLCNLGWSNGTNLKRWWSAGCSCQWVTLVHWTTERFWGNEESNWKQTFSCAWNFGSGGLMHGNAAKHNTSNLNENLKGFRWLCFLLGHVNIYMFHGGTKISALWMVSNFYDKLEADVTPMTMMRL